MRIALLGTRGVPARYGGFETAVEQIGGRLAARGHDVTVYCRGADRPRCGSYQGMRLVHLPAAHVKAAETLSHTALSIAHVVLSQRVDVAIVFNSANAPLLPALKARRIPTAVHVDGLEWMRTKWGGVGQRYYRLAEALAVRWADALIADAQGICDYYDDKFQAPTELLTYGAPIQHHTGSSRLGELGLDRHGYYLVVARFEPENHVEEILLGYRASTSRLPLVVVGSAPYANAYKDRVSAIAGADPRINLLGAVWDQELLDQLYANARTYLHGHSVGGTNPSLLRAMGAGAPVIAFDVVFNREVLGEAGRFFHSPADLPQLLTEAEDTADARERGCLLRARAEERYRWSDVAQGYENLLFRLAGEASASPSRGLLDDVS